MDGTKGRQPARGSQSQKTVLSSDCRLQLACMKLESLVMPYQNDGVNTFPGLVHTARHITKVDCTRSPQADPQRRQRTKVCFMIGVKSEQGSRRRTCGWIT